MERNIKVSLNSINSLFFKAAFSFERWIKYEQDLDYETGLWSKPYVAPLLYQSLSYLKTGLQYGNCD
jgi:hypothetical protein